MISIAIDLKQTIACTGNSFKIIIGSVNTFQRLIRVRG